MHRFFRKIGVYMPYFNPMVSFTAHEAGRCPMVASEFLKIARATEGLQSGYGWATNKKGPLS
jgi:hypothetical protein